MARMRSDKRKAAKAARGQVRATTQPKAQASVQVANYATHRPRFSDRFIGSCMKSIEKIARKNKSSAVFGWDFKAQVEMFVASHPDFVQRYGIDIKIVNERNAIFRQYGRCMENIYDKMAAEFTDDNIAKLEKDVAYTFCITHNICKPYVNDIKSFNKEVARLNKQSPVEAEKFVEHVLEEKAEDNFTDLFKNGKLTLGGF